jgi:lipopolysaccharide transport system permease protein
MEYDVIIEPGKGLSHYWRDLWNYRELFYFLSWRDIMVRYKQTIIGVAWSVIRPVMTMVVFTVIFGKLANLPSAGVPYPILVFAALLPWQFFANSIGEGSNALVANSSLLTKVYFPRLIMPASSAIVSLIDFLISFVILLIMSVYYQFIPSWQIVFIPLFLALAFMASMGISLWLSALNVKYRDFRYIVPFIIQFGLYISPVGFISDIVPAKWRLIYSLNPMAGIIDGFRWSIIGNNINWLGFLVSSIVTLGLFVFGLWYFRKTEKMFADII